jgi:alpha-L-fucosidase 2
MIAKPTPAAVLLVTSVLGIAGVCSGPVVAPLAREQNQTPRARQMTAGSLEPASVVGRSDIVLERPNLLAREAMPLGNGRLGVAVWGEEGFTAQLNRADTLPNRLSPGQVVLPGLKTLVAAADYGGRVDLYNGEFVQRGGGMTATAFVQPDTDVLVVEVKGADPSTVQTATLHLWAPRAAKIHYQDGMGIISETWKDATEAGASGETFGSLAAITAQGRDVEAKSENPLAVTISFRPNQDGSFRVLVAAPHWTGGDAVRAGTELLVSASSVSVQNHRARWNDFWSHVGLMRLSSADKSAEYMENLRLIDLYTARAESLGPLPGAQAGIGDLFSSIQDRHQWDPSAYWHWNLRMQVAANLGAGAYDLNNSYFNLYRENLQRIEQWTKTHMNDRAGACVPETMRFNGKGFENETWIQTPGLNCAADSKPYYNARTLSTGAEVSLWIWQQYLATGDRAFLAANYPVMAASSEFLLAYAKSGQDGLLHTYPSNAHETQWDVHDPTTDIAAMRSLFPAVLKAAQTLHQHSPLLRQIRAALLHLTQLPRTDDGTQKELLSASDDGAGHDVIAESYDPAAPSHNTENVGLEPVWPYCLIGDDGPQHEVGVRTYNHRPNKVNDDWSSDPIQAARLGLASEVRSTLIELTEKYQAYPSGLAEFMGPEFYVEQFGVVATALQEALVQDYDGLVRIAPAWPKDWEGDGTVYIQQGSSVDMQMRGGQPVWVIIRAGFSGLLRVRNPWPAEPFDVTTEEDQHRIAEANAGTSILQFRVRAGKSYLLARRDNVSPTLPLAESSPPATPKFLGNRSIGLAKEAHKE